MVNMTFKVDHAKIEQLDYLTVPSLKYFIKVVMNIYGFKPLGNGVYQHNSDNLMKLFSSVIVDFEQHDAVIDNLKKWTGEENGKTYDLLDLYKKHRQPFYESVIRPQRKREAEARKKAFLEKMKRRKQEEE